MNLCTLTYGNSKTRAGPNNMPVHPGSLGDCVEWQCCSRESMTTSKTGRPQEGLHIPLRLRHSRDSTQTGGRWQGGPGDVDGVVVLVVWGASQPSVKSVRRGVSDRRVGVKAAYATFSLRPPTHTPIQAPCGRPPVCHT